MRRLSAFSGIAVVLIALAACTASPGPETSAGPDTGSAPPPAPGGETIGEIRIVEDGAADGPGISIAEALAADATEPQLVNGILLKDLDGAVWLCSELLESSPPQCGEPKLRVTNFPPGSSDLDPANAADTGLQEDGGVVWIESYQVFGRAEPGL